jgi:peptidoglycan/xylan/chitin deacetylase (PgdA/CDA1 family)
MQLAPLYPIVYQLLKPAFPGCLWAGPGHSPLVALTFDDGPHPRYTPKLLEVLDTYDISATFFWLGVSIKRAPQIAQAVYERGHWMGLHGYTHQAFPLMSEQQLKQSLEQTQWEIAQALQLEYDLIQQTVRDVRPPNGLFMPQTLEQLCRWNYRPVMWSVVPEDWVRPGVSVVVQRVIQQVRPGSLIVLHDGYFGGEDVAATAAELIPRLLDQGYQFVSVNQLWQSCQVANR